MKLCKYHSRCEQLGEDCYQPKAKECLWYNKFEEEKELGIGAIDPQTVRRLDDLDNGGLKL